MSEEEKDYRKAVEERKNVLLFFYDEYINKQKNSVLVSEHNSQLPYPYKLFCNTAMFLRDKGFLDTADEEHAKDKGEAYFVTSITSKGCKEVENAFPTISLKLRPLDCPYCKKEMVSGRLTVRSSIRSRVIFSPDTVVDGFAAKWLPGTRLDNKLQPGEREVLSHRGVLLIIKNPSRPAFRCRSCKFFLLPDGPLLPPEDVPEKEEYVDAEYV